MRLNSKKPDSDELPETHPRWIDLLQTFQSTAADEFRRQRSGGIDETSVFDSLEVTASRCFDNTGIPEFDDDGYLPASHRCNFRDFNTRFGTTSDRRRNLIQHVERWVELCHQVSARRLLINGSFVTEKPEPGDVDAAILVSSNFRELLQQGVTAALDLWDLQKHDSGDFQLFVLTSERAWWEYWRLFTDARDPTGRRVCKGVVEVTF